ncbi:MAG: hypothetical protein V2A54_13630 [Bacteroidota bacterium]
MKKLIFVMTIALTLGCVKQSEGPLYEVTVRKDGQVEKITVRTPDKSLNYLFTFRENAGLLSVDCEKAKGEKVHAAFHLNGNLKEYWTSLEKKLHGFSVFMQNEGLVDHVQQSIDVTGNTYLNQKLFFNSDGLVDESKSRFLLINLGNKNENSVQLNIQLIGMKGESCLACTGDFDESFKVKDSTTLVRTEGAGNQIRMKCTLKPGQKVIRGYVMDYNTEKNIINGERIYFTKTLAE